jgi:hypothetical protein
MEQIQSSFENDIMSWIKCCVFYRNLNFNWRLLENTDKCTALIPFTKLDLCNVKTTFNICVEGTESGLIMHL